MKVSYSISMKENKLPNSRQPQQASGSVNATRNALPWSTLEQQVVRMQMQIAHASQRGERQTVHSLQQQLMESEAARLLAVRRVAEENAGRDTAGVDGVKSLTAAERLAMAATIHPRNWPRQPPMPVRRVWVAKAGTSERRPLAILPMIDRCKQALVKLALEPEWETKFEAHSYGYRPGRGAHDAIAALLVAIERQPAYVFDADIEGAFEHVNQAVVLEKLQTFPALRQAISAWLTAGVVDGTTYLASETGIAQGGVLSPLLMNVALHGMEAVVSGTESTGANRQRPLLVRYADDFVIVHPVLKDVQQAARRVRQWLARMGLHLHEEKTRFAHTLTPYEGQTGFDFLGFHIQQCRETEERNMQRSAGGRHSLAPLVQRFAPQEQTSGVKTIVSPAQDASKRHLTAIEQRLQQLQTAPQARVITELNPLIIGWAAYYNGVVPTTTMNRYDQLLEQRLLQWAEKRHPGKSRDWLLARYWQRSAGNKRVFATVEGIQLRTYRQTKIL